MREYKYTGKPEVSLEQMLAFLTWNGASTIALDLADGIYEVTRRMRWNFPAQTDSILDPVMGTLQMIHETGWGFYRGVSKPYNPAGIKLASATGDTPEDFEIPDTAFHGARMLANHASAYTHGPVLGTPHGRYYVARDINASKPAVRYVDELVGRWATDNSYTDHMKRNKDALLQFVDDGEITDDELPEMSTWAFYTKNGWQQDCRITRNRQVVGVYRTYE